MYDERLGRGDVVQGDDPLDLAADEPELARRRSARPATPLGIGRRHDALRSGPTLACRASWTSDASVPTTLGDALRR